MSRTVMMAIINMVTTAIMILMLMMVVMRVRRGEG